jgi:hypothetical protein
METDFGLKTGIRKSCADSKYFQTNGCTLNAVCIGDCPPLLVFTNNAFLPPPSKEIFVPFGKERLFLLY